MNALFQIDLRFEARNIERFRENFRNVGYVKFPKPLHPFVTRTVLVETFEVSADARVQYLSNALKIVFSLHSNYYLFICVQNCEIKK